MNFFPFILQAIPTPNEYFWYVLGGLLGAFAIFVIGKYYGSIEERFKKTDKRFGLLIDSTNEKFDGFMEAMTDLKVQQNKHNSSIESHAEKIERHEDILTEYAKERNQLLVKQTEALTQMLSVMTNWKDSDDDNPTVRRLRNQK